MMLIAYIAPSKAHGYDYHSTVVRLLFDCSQTAIRSVDDLHYDRRPNCCELLNCG